MTTSPPTRPETRTPTRSERVPALPFPTRSTGSGCIPPSSPDWAPRLAPSVPGPPGGSTRHRSLPWLAPLLAGAAGALLTVTVLALTGSFDRSSDSHGIAAVDDSTTIPAATIADTLTRLSPSVVAVFARDAQGSRRGSGVCVRHGSQLLTSTRASAARPR